MKLKTSKQLVQEAMDKIKTITPSELKDLQKKNPDLILIDIRDIRELQKEGKIPNAFHIPRGMLEFWLDPNSAYFKEGKLDINKPMILFCAGGLRSALATKTLLEMGFEKVSHIDGGFSSMRANGFKVE